MSDNFHFNTITTPSTSEFKDRGSKFLAYAFPIQNTDDFKNHLKELKKEHAKAAHHCFAYRIGTDGNTFRSSDDGEPSGSAGKPILGQIDSKQLTNILLVVVRYFGGTLLGVPGLINAYKTAAVLALQLTPIVQKPILELYNLQFDYTNLNAIMLVIKLFGCEILKQENQLFYALNIGIPKSRVNEVLFKLKEMRGIVITDS